MHNAREQILGVDELFKQYIKISILINQQLVE